MHRFAYLAGFALTSSAGVVFVLLSDLQDRYGLPSWGIGAIASSGFVASLLIQLLLALVCDLLDKLLELVFIHLHAKGGHDVAQLFDID